MNMVIPAKDRPKENTNDKPIMGIKAVDAVTSQSNGIKGAYVKEIIIGSAAAIAGIHPTDIIVQVDEILITSLKDLDNAIKLHKAKDTIKYKIFRNGDYIEINVVLS